MTQEKLLILTGEGYGLIVDPTAESAKRMILASSSKLTEINSSDDSATATSHLKQLGEMRLTVEKSRVAVKAPVLAVGKQIDDLAKSFAADIMAEESRVKMLQKMYADKILMERQRLEREIESARRAEFARQQEREKAIRDAESAAFNAETPEQEIAVEAVRQTILESYPEPTAPPIQALPELPKGARQSLDYEIIDIDALYRFDSSLVSMTERRKEILTLIATLGGNAVIPGLKISLKTTIR